MIEFKLSEIEETAAYQFMDGHRHPEFYKGTIGGHISFLFTPTGVGDACSIKCAICNKEKNITNYNNW